ncbi:hypothetical protein [Actinomadura rugatobispora]|uniref:YfhO family protein n=1 Tax=Actinomadura rugatobispora TaxID=1994 RepID=A0ABW0ZLQ8_9ACTN|nr:hypothetical protein GCM10010200_058380 [Actinomadura rugatobispora]
MGRTRHHPAAALTGLGLGLLVLGPGLAPGFVLSYDMVFVPDPAFTRMTFGLTGTVPRHVPSDVVVTALAAVVPAWAAQRLVLLGVFVMACTAAASLVPSRRLLPRLVAGVCYAWNPFVAERLLLGQWALLLGYAALPWVLVAASRAGERGGGRRLVCALIPAAVGGFAALAMSGLAALLMVPWRGGWGGRAKVVAALAVLSLPWLVPGLLRPGGVPGDGVAVEAFAARADTPFGTLGSLLLLGGVWNGETVPVGYGAPVTASLWALVVAGALFAFGRFRDRVESWWRGAAIAAVAGFAVAALGAVAPPVLEGAIGLWSGLAVFRDGQQFVAPLAVVVAVGLGLAADRAIEARHPAVAVGALLAPVVLLPSLAWGAAGQLRSVDYPSGWARAKQIIEADREPGDVLVLPWAAYRSYPWNHGRRVLDPLPRYLHRPVIVNDAVTVDATTVAPEDPKAVRLDGAIRAGGPLTEVLRAAGVRYVVVDAGGATERLPGAERLVQDKDLVLYRIPGTRHSPEENTPVTAVVAAWIVVSVALFWSLVTRATTLGSPLLGSIPRRRAP